MHDALKFSFPACSYFYVCFLFSFSNLFSGSEKNRGRRSVPDATIQFTQPSTVRPVGDPNRAARDKTLPIDKSRAFDFLQDDL